MKRKLLTALLVAALAGTTAMGIAACDKGHEHTFSDKWETNETQHWHKATCEHTDEKGSLGNHVYDNDADTDCNVCGYTRTVDNGSTDVFTAPTVNVLADPVEITAGEEFNYIEALDVSDEYDEADALNFSYTAEPELDLSDPAEGTYVLTITVTNSKGKSTTVTMNVSVTAPLPSLVVEVEKEADAANWTAEGAHEAKKMVFSNERYIVIDNDTQLTTEAGKDENNKDYPAGVLYEKYARTAVYHNTRSEEVTVHMQGSGGETVILDKTGYVIEARDGANGQFVCATNPRRNADHKTFTYGGETVQAANNGFYMVIPAGGFAIVVSNDGTFGESGDFNKDGRGWLNKNLVFYGYTAKIYLSDEPADLLNAQYENHAPVVLTAEEIAVPVSDGTTLDDLKTQLVAGISYIDDKGTFLLSDDVKTELAIELVGTDSEPAYNNAVEGVYVFTLKITDADGLYTQFNRTVKVRAREATNPTADIDGVWYEFTSTTYAVNPTPEEMPQGEVSKRNVVIYNYTYTGKRVVNDYGMYFIVDAEGKIVSIYSPFPGGGLVYKDGEQFKHDSVSSSDILNQPQISIPVGGFLICGCNGFTGAGGLRAKFDPLFRDKGEAVEAMIGKTIQLYNIDWQPAVKATAGSTVKTTSGSIFVINTNVDASLKNISAYVYDKTFTGTVYQKDSGVAVVIGADGKIKVLLDAANGYYMDPDHTGLGQDNLGNNRLKFTEAADSIPEPYKTVTGTNYCQLAFSNLAEGDWLLILPYDASMSTNPRQFGLDLRSLIANGTVERVNFEIPDATPDDGPVTTPSITVNGNKLDVAKYVVDKDNAVAADSIIFYNHGFSGKLVTNTHGVAVVVSKTTNKTVRVYCGAYGTFYDKDHTAESNAGCTTQGYVSEAFNSLAEDEYVIIFTNGGNDRDWALNNARVIDADVVLANISLDAE